MLLLLESRPVLGASAYDELRERVINRYWEMATLHRNDFLPFMLVNDIIRYWRVILLNHESRLEQKRLEAERKLACDPRLDERAREAAREQYKAELLLERRVSSYKLRFSRCLTCFASIGTMLAATTRDEHFSQASAMDMTSKSPLERLEKIKELDSASSESVDRLLEQYGDFLKTSQGGKDDLRKSFQDDARARALSDAGSRFAEGIFKLISTVGEGNALFRYCVV